MRVISGTARGRKLESPAGEATRPTVDRAKEGIFSAVQFLLPGAVCLDLFAGSGQLGIEALSRGAAKCVFVEMDGAAAELIKRNLKYCGFFDKSRVAAMTAEAFLASTKERFDLIFADPPYHSDLCLKLLPQLSAALAPGGTLLCETERKEDMPQQAGDLILEKSYKYGKVRFHRYTKPLPGEEIAPQEEKEVLS